MSLNRDLSGSREKLNFDYSIYNKMSDLSLIGENDRRVMSQYSYQISSTPNDIWTDDYLTKIKIIKADYDKDKIVGFMSNFHKALMTKDSSKSKVFVKYWSYLIVTGLDPFSEDSKELALGLVLDSVHKIIADKQEGLTTENIATLKAAIIEPIDFSESDSAYNKDGFVSESKETDLKTKDGRLIGKINVGDKDFHSWYTDAKNLANARKFFFIYCINLMRAVSKSSESVVINCAGKFATIWSQFSTSDPPPSLPTFDDDTVKFISEAFKTYIETYRRILRMILDDMYLTGAVAKIMKKTAFYTYAIAVPLKFGALHIPKLIATGMNGTKYYVAFFDRVLATKNRLLEAQVTTWFLMMASINHITVQNELFLASNSKFKGKKCELWEYSRVIDPMFFGAIAGGKNKELLALCTGFSNQQGLDPQAIYALKEFKDLELYRQMGIKIREEIFGITRPSTSASTILVPQTEIAQLNTGILNTLQQS